MVFRLKRSLIFLTLFIFLIVFASFPIRQAAITSAKESNKKVAVPILMYHHFLKDKTKLGEYVITPEDFENDIKILLKKGYTTISIADLENFIQSAAPLPEKPIIITVDDGYLSFYEYAFPILKKYNCKAVFSAIGFQSEFYSDFDKKDVIYTHVTFDNIKEMLSSSLIEIGNHSYNMHDLGRRHGIKKLYFETEEEYKKLICEDISKAQNLFKEKTNYEPYIYTYPFGYHSKLTDEIIKSEGFKASFICEEKINYIGKYSSLYNLCRFNRANGIDFEKFFEKIEKKMIL